MAKCPLNLDTIKRHLNSEMRRARAMRNPEAAQEVLNKMYDWINDTETGMEIETSQDSTSAAGAILEVLKRYGIPEDNNFNIRDISNSILELSQGILRTTVLTTEHLVDTPTTFRRAEANRQFLSDAYGLARDVSLYALSQASRSLFDAMFINRGSVIGLPIGIVKNDGLLNSNIRQYLKLLFSDIMKYLHTVVGSKDTELKKLLDCEMFDSKGELTDEFKKLFPMIKNYFRASDMTSDQLRNLYAELQQDGFSPSAIKLNAYNAYVLLNNFDSYIDSLFGKVIKIKNFNKLGGADKYSMAETTANVFKTWRTNDNIMISDEVDNVTKLLINTTPLYSAINKLVREGLYLNFADFEYMIGKIKDLVFLPEAGKIVFNDDWINANSSNTALWDTLSADTRKVLKGESLRSAINKIRRNPKASLHAFFELLSNDTFINNAGLEKLFSQDEKNKLYSLYKAIFNPTDPASIYSITRSANTHDFYAYLTQTADSIFKIKYLQYYKDDDGHVKLRTLLDANVFNLERKIKLTANGNNNIAMFRNFELFMQDYSVEISFKKADDGSETDMPELVSFKIPGTEILATVDLKLGKVSWTEKGIIFNKFTSAWDQHLDFIDKILRLNFGVNRQLAEHLQEIIGDRYGMSRLLFDTAARVLSTAIVNKTYFENRGISNIKEDIENIFGTTRNYNYNLDLVDVLSNDKDGALIRNIAKAQSNVLGQTTASIVRDGSGNAQSNLSLSRLMGSYPSQYDLQIRMENSESAMKDAILISEEGLFKGIYVAKEFHSVDEDKNVVVMTPAEMTYSNIVHDYIGGLLPSQTVIGNGIVGFLPSVNSDKSTAARILIDLNTVIDGKALKDYSIPETKVLIAKEFGKIYTKMWDNVKADWLKFDTLCPELQMITTAGRKLSFAEDFSKGFANINQWWKEHRQDSLEDFIKSKVLEYNRTHRLKPLTLIDLVHFKSKGGLIYVNETFASQIARFAPNNARVRGIETSKYVSEETFWKKKNKDVLKSLLKSGLKINTTDNTQSELAYIRDNYKDWVNSSGDLIYAKVDGVNITSITDIVKSGSDLNYAVFIDKAKNIELNPIIEQYNLFDYLFTQEWMNSTVGSFIAHPDKSKTKHKYAPTDKEYNWEHGNIVLELEASQFAAQHKRNVSFTAAMHAFLLNTLDGIPSEYNIAVIDDINDYQGTIPGVISKISPFDGATFVNPFVVYLENNSLEGAKAGITKKLFVHFYDARTGTGGIIKTAGFGLTNDWIRNSPFLLKMMWKMTHHTWINEDGTAADVDITKGYNGRPVEYKDVYYHDENKVAYRLLWNTVTRVGTNTYDYSIQNQETGEIVPIKGRVINNNYDLWKFFGGENSLHETKKGLEYSNTSVENVVTAINNCAGLDLNGNIIKKNDTIDTLDDLWLPLKHSDVHYLPTAGAVKQGAANINSASKYNDGDPTNPASGEDYNIQRIHMYLAGIQLDKEHHADLAEISMMTQVISACAARGYTFEAAAQLYDALRTATDHGLKDHFEALTKFFDEKDRDGLREIVMKSIIDNLGNSATKSDNFAQLIASDIIKAARNGEKIVYKDLKLPLSDPTVRAKVMSTIAVFLTNSGIKNKIPGILSVLTPSYNIFKLYNGKKYENTSKAELAEVLKTMPNILKSGYGVHYNEGDTSTLFLGNTFEFIPGSSVVNADTAELVPIYEVSERVFRIDIEEIQLDYNNQAWRSNPAVSDHNFDSFDEYLTFRILQVCFDEKKAYNKEGLEMGQTYTFEDSSNVFRDIQVTPESLPLLMLAIDSGQIIGIEETDENFISRRSEEALKKMLSSSISSIELGRTYNITYADNHIESRLINTPVLYKQLKRDVLAGKVISVIENVTVGRDLAAYNVRFATEDGYQFQLWDLDSAQALFSLNEIDKVDNVALQTIMLMNLYKSLGINSDIITSENISQKKAMLKADLQRHLLNDLFNLSDEGSSALEDAYSMMEQITERQKAGKNVDDLSSKLESHIMLQLGIKSLDSFKNEDGSFDIWKVLRALGTLTTVSINNRRYTVNPKTIKTQAYEIIMPRVFATNFGLTEFDDLNTIVNDPDFFVKKAIRNLHLGIYKYEVANNNYSVKLINGNGDHLYLLHSSLLSRGTNLTLVENALIIELDGKTYRVDQDGNTLYEIHDPANDKIYTDGEHEIIVTDDMTPYINHMHYDNIKLSRSLLSKPTMVLDLMELFKTSSKRKLQRFYNSVKANDIRSVILNNEAMYNITEENYMLGEHAGHPIVRSGRAKHTSFLKSLDIVAARIPAQSMQSFMPMKVVAFDNPDINTAHVSTLQILLQGSDYK